MRPLPKRKSQKPKAVEPAAKLVEMPSSMDQAVRPKKQRSLKRMVLNINLKPLIQATLIGLQTCKKTASITIEKMRRVKLP